MHPIRFICHLAFGGHLLNIPNQIFVKEFPVLKSVLDNVSMATPYPGAKMHYLLDPDNIEMIKRVVDTILPLVPAKLPKK